MSTWHTFNNFGYTLDKVPSEVMSILKTEREKRRVGVPESRDMNIQLAGQIDKEYDVSFLKDVPQVKHFLHQVLNIYREVFDFPSQPNNVIPACTGVWDIEIGSLWMNIQEQGEYNPIHAHGGVVSFVIWFEIPYDLAGEKKLSNSRYSNLPANGDFFFHPINTLGRVQSIPMNVDKNKEGTICMFDAGLLHSATPFFTTDKQRVTFSGNFFYKERKNV